MSQYRLPTIDSLQRLIISAGSRVVVRGQETRELLGFSASMPLGAYPRRVRMAKRLASVEAGMMLAGVKSQKAVLAAAPKADLSLFTDQAYYGPLVKTQLPQLVAFLKSEPSTRRAVLYLGRVSRARSPGAPCTNSVQFLIREGRLNLVLQMRSWDLAWGYPTDIAAFGLVGLVVASFLNVVPGDLHVSAGSLHYYTKTAHLLESDDPPIGRCVVKMPEVKYWREVQAHALNKLMESWTWLKLD